MEILRLMTWARHGDISFDTTFRFLTSIKSRPVAFDPLSPDMIVSTSLTVTGCKENFQVLTFMLSFILASGSSSVSVLLSINFLTLSRKYWFMVVASALMALYVFSKVVELCRWSSAGPS